MYKRGKSSTVIPAGREIYFRIDLTEEGLLGQNQDREDVVCATASQ